MEFYDILVASFWVFLAVGVGYLTRLFGIMNDASEKSIMQLILMVLYPCFILSRVPGSDSLSRPSVVAMALAAGFCLTCAGLLVSFGTGIGIGISQEQGRSTFCLATALQNYGFIPIPLIESLFPESASETVGVLFVHNLGLEIAMWSIGIVVLSGTMKGALGRLVNGPTISICLGLILNFTGVYRYIPTPCTETMSQLGNCTIPISLLLVGATLAGVVSTERIEIRWKVVFGALFVRFLIMPAIFLLAAWMVSSSRELQTVLVIESAMPTAIFPIVLAKHFGGKPGVAVQIVLASSAASLIITPMLILFGCNLFSMAN